ncbi:MAG: Biotin carboxyl carrier protein of acetyl-CoA carboxylase [Pseudomonadota bacterium]|jgi:acetyl-CoA carboxylase biotin carboxyl carrier protein
MDIKDIENIIKILKQNEVTEFELEQDGTRVKLSRTTSGAFVASESRYEMVPAVQVAMAAPAASNGAAAQEDLGRFVKVESPIVGTFYRKPSPDADVFVKEGDTVSKGDTLCIIEAMKLMNEIEAPTSGKIVKILGVEGQVIEFGEVLFLIDPAV